MTKMALPVITKRGYLSGQMEIFWLIRCPTRTGVLVNLVTADTWTVWKPAAKDGQWPREAVQQADCHLCVKSKVCCVVYRCHNNRPKLSLSPHTSRSYSFKLRKHSFKSQMYSYMQFVLAFQRCCLSFSSLQAVHQDLIGVEILAIKLGMKARWHILIGCFLIVRYLKWLL